MSAQNHSPTAKTWSTLQQNIFAFVLTMVTHLVIIARAGCGKTTTIIECAARLPKGSRIIFCAFNKAIVKELETRLPRNVECKTLHSIGLAMIRSAFGNVRVDEFNTKTKDIAKRHCVNQPEGYLGTVIKIVSFAKNTMAQDKAAVLDLAVEFAEDKQDPAKLTDLACAVLNECARTTNIVDFDDMVFFPWYHDLGSGRYDFVIVDECQDMNAAQLYIAKSLMRADRGRMIIVGDDRQAIYGFRGADPRAIARMTEELDATVMPLNETYRCGKAIVQVANEVVPDFIALETAPDGEVIMGGDVSKAVPGNFILSRKNAPLMPLCLKFLAAGVPATIAGRDVAKMLMTKVEKSRARTVDQLVAWVDAYRAKELARLSQLDPDRAEKKIQEVNDTCDCLIALTEGVETIAEVKGRLETMFSDEDPHTKVVLSSVHKAKGLERETVYLLTETFMRGRSVEEDNLFYVGVTRAKNSLIFC